MGYDRKSFYLDFKLIFNYKFLFILHVELKTSQINRNEKFKIQVKFVKKNTNLIIKVPSFTSFLFVSYVSYYEFWVTKLHCTRM